MTSVDLSGLNEGQRRIASTLDGPLFVEAGAGSGKTFTLTQRIAWALSPGSGQGGAPFLDDIGQLLVITFTEAAAREIRERARATLARSGLREAALAVDAAWIGTIHGMCDRIVRRHAFDLGIDPAYEVCQPSDAAALFDEALDAEMGLARRDALADASLSALFDALDLRDVVARVRALRACARTAGGFERLAPPEGGMLPNALARLLDAYEALAATPGLTRAARAKVEPSLEALRELASLPATGRDAGRVDEALAACSLPRPSKALAELLPDARSALAAARALASLEAMRVHVPALISLARRVDDRYDHLKRERSLVDFDDLVSLASSVVAGDGRVASAYARRFRLVMVDEFQDTDDVQLGLISRLAGEGARSLVTVGDAQQSIYRFRGADVGVFEGRGRSLPSERHVRLDVNYRSDAAVLDFVERVCGGANGVLRGYMHLDHDRDRDDAYAARALPRVSVEVSSGPSRAGRAGRDQTAVLAAQVADRLAAYRDAGQRVGDMALLLGVTTNADVYLDALRARGLECVVTGGSVFASAPEVAVVCALLHALANPADTRSGLFPLLSSELFGLDANDFVQLGTRAQEALDAPTRRDIATGLDGLDLYRDASPSERLRRAAEIMGRALRRLAVMPVADVCLAVVRESGWLSRLEAEGPAGRARTANVLAAVRHVRDLAERLGLGPARAAVEFDRWLSSAKVAPASLAGDDADVVRVMTVHASKGLEFGVVALAECWGNMRPESVVLAGPAMDGSTAVVVCPPGGVATDDVEVGVAPRDLAEWHRLLRARDLAEGDEEHARLLYVGLTRAREALVVALACPLTKRGVSSRLAGGVVDALFGGELPPTGVSSVDYGGTEPAAVRHVALAKRDGELVVDAAGSLPGFEGDRSPGAVSPDSSVAPSDDGAEGRTPATFTLYEVERDFPADVVASGWRAREGVFSYSSAHAQAEREVAPAAAGKGPTRDRSTRQRHPSAAQRRATEEGAPVVDDQDKATSLGSAFHELARAMAESGDAPSPALVDAQARRWRLSDRQRARLDAALARWKRSDLRREALSHDLVHAEVPFFLRVDDAPYGDHLEGAIDLLCRDRGGTTALVVDYKTGDVGLAPDAVRERHETQANFYAYVLMAQGLERVTCAFVCVEMDDGHGQPLVVRYDFDEGRPPRL